MMRDTSRSAAVAHTMVRPARASASGQIATAITSSIRTSPCPSNSTLPLQQPGGANQSIWVHIHIPETAPTGTYKGTISITENGALTWQIPIALAVRNFTLPDLPNVRTMVDLCHECINDRYLGEENAYPEPGDSV